MVSTIHNHPIIILLYSINTITLVIVIVQQCHTRLGYCIISRVLTCINTVELRAFSFFNLTYSQWTSSLPSCLWSLRIFPSLPGSRLTIFYRDASSALLQLVNQWLNFTYSRSHAFRYERKNTNPTLVRIELTH